MSASPSDGRTRRRAPGTPVPPGQAAPLAGVGRQSPDEVRERLLRWRRALAPAVARRRSAAIAEAVVAWPAFSACRCLLAYIATPREVQTDAIIAAAQAAGKVVCAPAVGPGGLALRRLLPGRPTAAGALGVREPDRAAPAVPEAEVDLVLVPGVAFDRAGHRVGRGGGHYDRLLPRLARARRCGLAFAEQVVAGIEPAPWDAAVEFLCTDAGMWTCGTSAGAGDGDRG